MRSIEQPSRPLLTEDPFRPVVYERLGPKVWITGAVMLVLGVVTAVLMFEDFSSSSYVYLGFYTIPANTAISVFPHEPALIWFGKNGNIWWAAIAASVGTMVAGWLDHTVFVPVMNLKAISGYKDLGWYRKIVRYFKRQPFWTLVVTGFTPIPFFPFKFLAFSVHYPMRRYLAALLVGRFPRYLLLAWLGRLLAIPDWILIAFFGAISLTYAWKGIPKLVSYLRERQTSNGASTDGSDGVVRQASGPDVRRPA